MPAFEGGDDFIGVGGPDARLWVIVGLSEEAFDRGLFCVLPWGSNAGRDRRLSAVDRADFSEPLVLTHGTESGAVGSLHHYRNGFSVHEVRKSCELLAELGIGRHRVESGRYVVYVLYLPDIYYLTQVTHERLKSVCQLPSARAEKRYKVRKNFVETGILTELQIDLCLYIVCQYFLPIQKSTGGVR